MQKSTENADTRRNSVKKRSESESMPVPSSELGGGHGGQGGTLIKNINLEHPRMCLDDARSKPRASDENFTFSVAKTVILRICLASFLP